jgi:DnaJ homolog subfamily C member 8
MGSTDDGEDVEAMLQAQATALEREQEVERVLKAFRLNPFDILDLPFDATERCALHRHRRAWPAGQRLHAVCKRGGREIKLRYRKQSLLVHPDKCKHPKAEAAFASLATAQTDALDFGRRSMLTRVYEEAQQRLVKERKLPADSAEVRTPDFRRDLRKAANLLLAEIEWEKKKMVQRELEEQGRQAAEVERREEERKRKAEEARGRGKALPTWHGLTAVARGCLQEKEWEKTRESRVASWRDFQEKKKVRKHAPELRPPKAVVEDASKSFIKRVNRANE